MPQIEFPARVDPRKGQYIPAAVDAQGRPRPDTFVTWVEQEDGSFWCHVGFLNIEHGYHQHYYVPDIYLEEVRRTRELPESATPEQIVKTEVAVNARLFAWNKAAENQTGRTRPSNVSDETRQRLGIPPNVTVLRNPLDELDTLRIPAHPAPSKLAERQVLGPLTRDAGA